MTFEIFREQGNVPDENERFARSARGVEISVHTSLRILVGTLLGPEPLLRDIEEISFETSSEVTGERNMEFKLGRFKKDVKFLSLSGILDRIVSATEEKKELKEFATRMGSEVTVSFILSEIGLEMELDLRDMISFTPCQILRMLFEF